MSIDKIILEDVFRGLNALEGDDCKNVTITTRNKNDVNELKNYLDNYNVEVDDLGGVYSVKVSKKESK